MNLAENKLFCDRDIIQTCVHLSTGEVDSIRAFEQKNYMIFLLKRTDCRSEQGERLGDHKGNYYSDADDK